ncbi:hypothetical protein BBJ28_00001307 [Nothophytophthora sp. Chile5]|nr:hypothetical protein BBJ28_00001307 [Nothophytophthora sp. Chile5]
MARIELTRGQLAELQDQVDRYDAVASTLVDLPKKLTHQVMVPLGKRAMMPGKLVRTNEVLAHLGDEYFAWRTAPDAVEVIQRKKKGADCGSKCQRGAYTRIQTAEELLRELNAKQTDVGSVAQLQKMYEDENIREIQETEEESELGVVPRATDEGIERAPMPCFSEYFEMEEEERLKAEQATWNWDDMMKRMEELEARESAGGNGEEPEQEESTETQAAALKAKGNDAFARRRFQAATQFYSQAIELEPTSHLLYGNRAAAYHRLKKYELALADADAAVALHEPWVKGHYRRACALAALEKFADAADAFERAMELCPTDKKLEEKVEQMREKAEAQVETKSKAESSHEHAAVVAPKPKPAPSIKASASETGFSPSLAPPAPVSGGSSFVPASSSMSSSAAFSGNIMEHEIKENVQPSTPAATTSLSSVASPIASSSPLPQPQQSRFHGTNYTGQTVTLEPVGEAVRSN